MRPCFSFKIMFIFIAMPKDDKFVGTVMVCPLNWGLGHAARCVPVISTFQRFGHAVVVAGDGPVLHYLKGVFGSTVQYYCLPDIHVSYPLRGSFALKMLWQLPRVVYSIWKEHILVQRLIDTTGASLLVSDNRYGLFSGKTKTIFITHQLFIKAPQGFHWLEPLLFHCSQWFIRRFHSCWVPDFYDAENLSGDLSHMRTLPRVRFVGPLSRFYAIDVTKEQNPLPDGFPEKFVLVILSGPEPQRSMLEKTLQRQFCALDDPVVFVRGVSSNISDSPFHLNVLDEHSNDHMVPKANARHIGFDHLPKEQLAYLIRRCTIVVCRPGYSTIMDLAVFGKKALVIPTPGQTEQEYLGRRMHEKGWVLSVEQDHVSVSKHLREACERKGIPRFPESTDLLEHAVNEVAMSYSGTS